MYRKIVTIPWTRLDYIGKMTDLMAYETYISGNASSLMAYEAHQVGRCKLLLQGVPPVINLPSVFAHATPHSSIPCHANRFKAIV